MVGALINLIIYLLVLGIVAWIIFYVIDALPLPDPFGRILRVAAVVLIGIVIIVLLLDVAGVATDFRVPRLNPQ